MDSTPPTLSQTDIEHRKQFLEDLKLLAKAEYEEMFRIIRHDVDYSENSNGVFFDLMLVSNEIFTKLTSYMELCREQRKNEDQRTQELDVLRKETTA
jgi:hypothetical protein